MRRHQQSERFVRKSGIPDYVTTSIEENTINQKPKRITWKEITCKTLGDILSIERIEINGKSFYPETTNDGKIVVDEKNKKVRFIRADGGEETFRYFEDNSTTTSFSKQ